MEAVVPAVDARRQLNACGAARPTPGCSFTARHKGYTHCALVRLKDRAALDVYQDHPAHLELKKNLLMPYVDSVLAGEFHAHGPHHGGR